MPAVRNGIDMSEAKVAYEFTQEMSKGDGFYLAAYGRDAALISWVQRPHRMGVLSLRDSSRWFPNISADMLQKMTVSETGWYHWAALPALSLSNGVVVQTISDLGSMRRELLVRRGDGTVVRTVGIDTPVGFVAASPSGRTLLAVSRVPRPRIVCYDVTQGEQ
jgi:hypothetical protein